MSNKAYANGHFNGFPINHVTEEILYDPSVIDSAITRYSIVSIIHKYISESNSVTQMTYMHYLLGKDLEQSAHILNISESSTQCFLHTFISRFHRFTVDQLKKGDIDIEETDRYIKCMQDQKMDDREVANSFEEDILTTKVMKHFLKHANLISQYFVATVSFVDALELITFIDFIRILPK